MVHLNFNYIVDNVEKFLDKMISYISSPSGKINFLSCRNCSAKYTLQQNLAELSENSVKKEVISAFEKKYIIENLLCNHFLKNSFIFICKFLCHISTVMHMFTVCIVNYSTCSEALIRIFISCKYLLYISICRGRFSSFIYLVSNWVL